MNDLEKLCEISAVSGYEGCAFDELSEIFQKYGLKEPKIDKFGNIYSEKFSKIGKKNILIDAHYDEIGLIVTEILDNGFVLFDTVGGIDKANLLCQEVEILGKNKKIYGIIGAVPPHLKKEDKEQPLIIDTGLKNACDFIKIGDPIKLKTNFLNLQNSQIASGALDNRAGLITALLIAQAMGDNVNLTVLASAREETGLQGAELFTQNKSFDLAIVIDVTHGYFDGLSDYRAFPVGQGFTVCLGGILDNNISRKMINYLAENNYKFNVEVEPSNPGTNAYCIVNKGIPAVMLSIPQKYMHTTVEVISTEDIQNLVKFVTEFFKE